MFSQDLRSEYGFEPDVQVAVPTGPPQDGGSTDKDVDNNDKSVALGVGIGVGVGVPLLILTAVLVLVMSHKKRAMASVAAYR